VIVNHALLALSGNVEGCCRFDVLIVDEPTASRACSLAAERSCRAIVSRTLRLLEAACAPARQGDCLGGGLLGARGLRRPAAVRGER
jgi:hypothetical protein